MPPPFSSGPSLATSRIGRVRVPVVRARQCRAFGQTGLVALFPGSTRHTQMAGVIGAGIPGLVITKGSVILFPTVVVLHDHNLRGLASRSGDFRVVQHYDEGKRASLNRWPFLFWCARGYWLHWLHWLHWRDLHHVKAEITRHSTGSCLPVSGVVSAAAVVRVPLLSPSDRGKESGCETGDIAVPLPLKPFHGLIAAPHAVVRVTHAFGRVVQIGVAPRV